MNYLSPGFRELSRKFGRQVTRLKIAAEKRKLSNAEAELGLLGWQQADFDPETQREVDKVRNFEREQSRLNNEAAGIAKLLTELHERRSAAREQHEEVRRKLSAQRRTVSEPMDRLQKQLAVYAKQKPEFEQRLQDLDREMREAQRASTQLLAAERETPESREDMLRLRERAIAIPHEKASLQAEYKRVADEIRSLEAEYAEKKEQCDAIDRQIEEAEAAFQSADRSTSSEIKAREREKSRLDKENDALESAKTDPYRQIGRVLANSGIAPLNQPMALEKVCRYRTAVQQLETKVQSSMALSDQEDPAILRLSYLVIGSIILALFALGMGLRTLI